MLRKINAEIALGFLIASTLWLGVFLWQSSQPPKHANITSQHCEGTKSECAKVSSDERIADYTWWLAVLTAGLVISGVVQFGFLIRSDNTTRIAAHAADLSARAAVAIELPIIQIAPHGFGFGSSADMVEGVEAPRTEWCALSDVRFSNLGRTKAFPISIKCGWFAGEKLPDIPIYTFSKQFRLGLIFEPDPSITPSLTISECVCENGPADFYNKVRDEFVNLWFFCSISYLDFMQTRHEVAFCWQRWETMGRGGFRPDPSPAYNQKT